ncbi:winged helix-turn-helix domain-containing protein [Flavobacterium sp. W21_SRS_FM6]|uniref:winged helix-turn-helix domain-containing protein n=1 Tax=Flavobacterium sp. W21_SRS_FM6 TaxID=3240268 RepID=UPI003F91040F
MSVESISEADARKLVLISQGLHRSNPFGTSLKATLDVIARLSYVQIDTISVVERAHHHCVWNRQNNYHKTHLDTLMQQKQVFEYWSHAAAYLPMSDYRFSLPRKHAIASGEKHWHVKDKKLSKIILQRIEQDGPLQAKDFEREDTAKNTGWWDWKPAKKALEQLFMEGELMVLKRQGFQKFYELTERVVPTGIDTSIPTETEFYDYLIMRFLAAQGLGSAEDIAYLRKGLKAKISRRCEQLLEDKQLLKLACLGQQYYALPQSLHLLKQRMGRKQVRFLSPFDNLLIQRKRLKQLFDFDYQIECYVPEPKRQYGYFSLPILWGSVFVGRMDAKINRASGVLFIRHLQLETKDIAGLLTDLLPSLQTFLRFNQGTKICLEKISVPEQVQSPLENFLRQQIESIQIS